MLRDSTTTAVVISAGVVGVISVYWWWSRNRIRIPQKWRQVGKLNYLAIYPLKSGTALSIKKGHCAKHGLQASIREGEAPINDRSLVIYDENTQRFVTGRQQPKVVLIRVVAYDDKKQTVTLEAPDMPPLEINLPQKGKTLTCQFFGEKIEALDCGDKAAKWIRDYLKSNVERFGFYNMNINARRKAVGTWEKFVRTYKYFKGAEFGLFSDLAPYMLLSKTSVDDLNERLEQPVSFRQFRGNFLVEGSKPYEEDMWEFVRIGSQAVFKAFKPCTRCVMTTIDPDQGVKDEKMQPLKTLKSYRQLSDPKLRKLEGDAPVMGNYFYLCAKGDVKVGDPIYVPDE